MKNNFNAKVVVHDGLHHVAGDVTVKNIEFTVTVTAVKQFRSIH